MVLGKGNETDPTNASAELKGKIASNQNTKRKSIGYREFRHSGMLG